MTDKEKAKEIAKKVYPDLKREYYPNDETYKDDCNRLIDLRGGFVRGLLYKEEPVGEELEEAANAYVSNEINYSHSRTDTFKAGAEWQKEQMMKEAVESKVTITSKGILLEDLRIEDFDYEDKVKLIVIKEEQ